MTKVINQEVKKLRIKILDNMKSCQVKPLKVMFLIIRLRNIIKFHLLLVIMLFGLKIKCLIILLVLVLMVLLTKF